MTTASGFWAESSAGNEEFEEVNMNRTLLQTDTYANLQTILDKEGMLGYDTTYNRFLTVDGGSIIAVQRIVLTTEANLPTFATEHAYSLYYTTDNKKLRYIGNAGTEYIVGYGDVSNSNSNITNVDSTASSYGSGTTLAFENPRHQHALNAHEKGGTAEIDGDKIDIDYSPTNYTPSTTPSVVNNVDNLSAHLAGIDDKIGNIQSAGSGESNVQANWTETNTNSDAYIRNKPTLAPLNAEQNVQANWTETNTASDSFIRNKPNIPNSIPAATSSDREYNLRVNTNGTTQWVWDFGEANVPSNWNATSGDAFIRNKPVAATSSSAGLMSSSDKTKLDGIATGAEANVQADWNETDTADDSFIKNKPVAATTSASGLMSSADKIKLDGIDAGAEANVQTDWNATSGDSQILNKPGFATTSADGLMSKEDKAKLNGIASGAEVNVQADWDETDTSDSAYIANKPATPTKIYVQSSFPSNASSGDLFIKTTNTSTIDYQIRRLSSTHINSPRSLLFSSNAFYILNLRATNLDDQTLYYESLSDSTPTITDLYGLNNGAIGITRFSNRLYVLDSVRDYIYAYNTYSNNVILTESFALHSSNSNPISITYYDNKLYVSDSSDNHLYAYNLSGVRQTSSELSGISGTDMAFRDNKFYILTGNEVEVYDSSGNLQNNLSFSIYDESGSPRGIDVYNNIIYILFNNNLIQGYDSSGRKLDGLQEIEKNNVYKYDGTDWNFETELRNRRR